jgi:uncharacterized protein YggE
VPTQLAFRTVAVVAIFAFVAGCLAAVANAQDATAPQRTVVASGYGIAKVTPKDPKSNASISAAVEKAEKAALPVAFKDAQTQAGELAAQAGIALGALVSISNQPSGGVFYGPFGANTGSFGPGIWCGDLRSRPSTIGKDGKRHYGKVRTRRVCRFPSTIQRSVQLTYAIA